MPRHDGTPSRSGPSVPNAQRKTVARLLRLTPEEDAALVAVADAWSADKAALVGGERLQLARVVGALVLAELGRRSTIEAGRKQRRKST